MKQLLLLTILCSSSWAALSVQRGQFAANTGATTVTVSTSFQGKCIMFSTHGHTSNVETANSQYSFGATDGTNVGRITWGGDDAVATTNTASGNSVGAAATVFSANTTPTVGTGSNISSVAFNSNNFVATFSTTPASAWLYDYILFGGTDVTNCLVGVVALNTTNGIQSISNVGFQGNFAFFFSDRRASATNSTSQQWGVGAAISSSKRWAFGGAADDAAVTSGTVNGMTIFRNDACLTLQNPSTNAVDTVVDFSQFTSNGFDINLTTAPGTAWRMYYLVIKGGQWDLGSFAKTTSAAADTVTSTFQPSLVGLMTSSPTANNTNTSNAVASFGSFDGTNQGGVASFHNDAINTVAKTLGDTTHCLIDYDRVNNPLATCAATANGFTATWSATGSAHDVGWFMAASNPITGNKANMMLLGVAN